MALQGKKQTKFTAISLQAYLNYYCSELSKTAIKLKLKISQLSFAFGQNEWTLQSWRKAAGNPQAEAL